MWAQRPHGGHTQGCQALLLPLGVPRLQPHRACPLLSQGLRCHSLCLRCLLPAASEPPGPPAPAPPDSLWERNPLWPVRGSLWRAQGLGREGLGDGCWDMVGRWPWASGSWVAVRAPAWIWAGDEESL